VSAVDNAILKLLDGSISWRAARRKVTPLLVELGMEKRLKHRAEQLSMGERQRVLIARALAPDPKLILADEPTGSLDQKRGREVFDLLIGLCRSRDVAMLLATHDPRAATVATHTHTLEDGRLVTRTPDDDLLGVG
jgi:putative ABC transport system ATP-binding protein